MPFPASLRAVLKCDLAVLNNVVLAVSGVRRPVFVNTLFNCLATISDTASFRPIWRPKLIDSLVAEGRCHLNGLAMDGTRPAYVTAVSRSDVSDGWRDPRHDGGVVIDVASSEIVASSLSMPHSPRLCDGQLWLLNSGVGQFGNIDPMNGRFTPVCFCPGYARRPAFIGRHAVIGQSIRLADYGGTTLIDVTCDFLILYAIFLCEKSG
jgi:uncharacterized protein (TIGR03032 family)